MISSQPEKLLRYLLLSIGDGNNFLAMHLGGLIFKLEYVCRSSTLLHYKLSIVTFDNPSVDEPEENVVASQNIVAHLTKKQCPYEHVASFVCKALPEYVIMHKGVEAERSLAHCQLYIVKTAERKQNV
jgi:hypothetical protein